MLMKIGAFEIANCWSWFANRICKSWQSETIVSIQFQVRFKPNSPSPKISENSSSIHLEPFNGHKWPFDPLDQRALSKEYRISSKVLKHASRVFLVSQMKFLKFAIHEMFFFLVTIYCRFTFTHNKRHYKKCKNELSHEFSNQMVHISHETFYFMSGHFSSRIVILFSRPLNTIWTRMSDFCSFVINMVMF